jgi:multidrug efflux system membrane fusion protein
VDRQELKVAEAKMRLAEATEPPGTAPGAPARGPRRPATVFFRIPESYTQAVVKKLDAGQPLKVNVYGRDGKDLLATGTLLAVDNQIETSTGTLGCTAGVVANEGVLLYPNQFVNVRMLMEAKRGVTLVPAEAVQRGAEGLIVVYVINPDGTVSERRITQGVMEAGVVEITSGLSPGQLVVVKAEGKLVEGTKVRYQLPAGQRRGASSRGATTRGEP